jgi:flagellar assembly factor FliW
MQPQQRKREEAEFIFLLGLWGFHKPHKVGLEGTRRSHSSVVLESRSGQHLFQPYLIKPEFKVRKTSPENII